MTDAHSSRARTGPSRMADVPLTPPPAPESVYFADHTGPAPSRAEDTGDAAGCSIAKKSLDRLSCPCRWRACEGVTVRACPCLGYASRIEVTLRVFPPVDIL
jgi:hypothetical protein